MSNTVLGRSSSWARGRWAQLPQRHTRVSHLLKTHDTSRKTPPYQGWIETSTWSWVGREEKPLDQDWAHRSAPDEEEEQGFRGPPWRDPGDTTHWALQPWDDPGRSQPLSCCEPRGTHRRPRNMTTLLRHAPAPAPETGWGSHRTLTRTQPVYRAVCVPPSPQTPPQCLWIQFTPPGARATHAGQSGQWGYRAGYLDGPGWPLAMRGFGEQGSGNILLHFPHSKSFKSLCDKDPLPQQLSDLSSSPVSLLH